MKKNFNNKKFEWLFDDITSSMPNVIFIGIILTYAITAALNVYFLPLPLLLSIPASLMLQFGRFSIVFIDFLNPSEKRSKYPPRVAAIATVIALMELWFSIQGQVKGSEFYAMFFFIGTIICFGYVLEIQFIEKGIDAYGIGAVKEPRKRRFIRKKPVNKMALIDMNRSRDRPRENMNSTMPIKFILPFMLLLISFVLPAQNMSWLDEPPKNSFMAYNWMYIRKIGNEKLEKSYFDQKTDQQITDTIHYKQVLLPEYWSHFTRPEDDNDLFMEYGTQTFEYIDKIWYFKGKSYTHKQLVEYIPVYVLNNFLNK